MNGYIMILEQVFYAFGINLEALCAVISISAALVLRKWLEVRGRRGLKRGKK